MRLETLGRDCLFLNWALPLAQLPRLDERLRYDVVRGDDGDYVFVSTVLFRQRVLEFPGVQFPSVSFPQLSFRICTLDEENVPSLLVSTILLPAWALPSGKLVARESARLATFDYPRQGSGLEAAPLRWRIKSHGQLEVTVTHGARACSEGPPLGSLEYCVAYFQKRTRWYLGNADGLRRIDVDRGDVQTIPVCAEIGETSLLEFCLDPGGELSWPGLHSCWLSPEAPFVLQIGKAKEGVLPDSLPAPG